MKKFLIQFFTLLAFSVFIFMGSKTGLKAIDEFNSPHPEKPVFLASDSLWVDSVYNSLNLEEKIGQLLMIPAYSREGEQHLRQVLQLIKKYKVGGIISFQGSPVRQVNMIKRLQQASVIPLLVSIDAEWGPGMRLDSTLNYPRQMMLGAIQNEALIYQMGYDIGRQLKQLGVHVNFAPVVDINNNAENPVINSRSFGEGKVNVARKALMYSRGLEDAGIISVFKHFPGHGDTNTDSHYSLPVIEADRNRLDSLELFPYKYGIQRGIPGVMTGHLHVPALDSRQSQASSLSEPIVTDLLKNTLNFQGLVFTDALGMKGVGVTKNPGELEAKAFRAGNDILLMPSNIPRVINQIKRNIKKGIISEEQLNHSVKKILFAKAWCGLNRKIELSTDSLTDKLNSPFYKIERDKLIRNAITVLKNKGGVLPFKNPESYSVASLTIGSGRIDAFSTEIKKYIETKDFYVNKERDIPENDTLFKQLNQFNTLIVSVQNTSQWPGMNYGIYPQTNTLLKNLDFKGNLVLVLFGNPYALNSLENKDKFDAIVLAYEDNPQTKIQTAQGIFGAFELKGRLPVGLSSQYPVEKGLNSPYLQRLSYVLPEEAGFKSVELKKIDSVVSRAIRLKATPGCQVLVARNNKVVWNVAYGYQTYSNKIKTRTEDLYDLASLTKITSTLPSLMRLEDQGFFSTSDTLGTYMNFPDTCNKNGLFIHDILCHQSGLTAWIPFYLKTLQPIDTSEDLIHSGFSYKYPLKMGPGSYANRNIVFKDSVFQKEYSPEFPWKVASEMYMNRDYRDTVYQMIINSELEEKEYRYSDLGYYLFHQLIEEQTDTLLYPYVYYNFYSKLGAGRLGYLPLNRFSPEEIVPTENDIIFRHQLLRGYVHDPGAAMLGGIAGHAGLFSNANDLAKMMQMYLNKGSYGGRRFLSPEVIAKYTKQASPGNGNRRGLGFDKAEFNPSRISPACKSVSRSSYGHTGFTGTMVWIDPEYQLIYIFLSNRIHPDQYNTKLVKEDVRTNIQEIIYEAMDF